MRSPGPLQSRSVQEVYFKKSDWKSDEQISVGTCVTFTMTGSKSRNKANDIRPITCSQEIYTLGKLHVGKYASIIGTTRRDSVRYYFQKTIHNLFFSTEDGKGIILQNLLSDLHSQKDVAYAADLDRSYIASIENGARNVSSVNIEKIAKALQVPVTDIIENAAATADNAKK